MLVPYEQIHVCHLVPLPDEGLPYVKRSTGVGRAGAEGVDGCSDGLADRAEASLLDEPLEEPILFLCDPAWGSHESFIVTQTDQLL
jgi:hypothetical protein